MDVEETFDEAEEYIDFVNENIRDLIKIWGNKMEKIIVLFGILLVLLGIGFYYTESYIKSSMIEKGKDIETIPFYSVTGFTFAIAAFVIFCGLLIKVDDLEKKIVI